jgi:hypothetical protein
VWREEPGVHRKVGLKKPPESTVARDGSTNKPELNKEEKVADETKIAG